MQFLFLVQGIALGEDFSIDVLRIEAQHKLSFLYLHAIGLHVYDGEHPDARDRWRVKVNGIGRANLARDLNALRGVGPNVARVPGICIAGCQICSEADNKE